jgi:cell division septation protein DedD
MTKDFKTPRQDDSPLKDSVTWILAGIALGLIIGLVYLLKTPAENNNEQIATQPPQVTPQTQQTPSQTSTENNAQARARLDQTIENRMQASIDDNDEPSFTYYAMLPNLEVEIPVTIPTEPVKKINKPQKKETAKVEKKPTKIKKGTYILQVGAFKTANEASRMKSKMQAMGINAYTEQTVVKGVSWHRVRIGPIPDTNVEGYRQKLHAKGVGFYLKKI